MALVADRYNNIALYYLQIAFRDANGYPMGQELSPNEVEGPLTTSAYLVEGVIDLTPSVPTIPIVTNQGSQRVISRSPVAASDYGAPVFQLSQRDETLDAYIKRVAVDLTTNQSRAIRADNMSQNRWDPFMSSFAIQVTNSRTGQTEWDNYTFLNHRIINTQDAGAAQVTGDVTNPNSLAWKLDLSLAKRGMDGMLIEDLAVGAANDEDGCLKIRSANPLAFTTFVADGVATTFTLPYLPISSSATGALQNMATKNGVKTAVTSISPTTGLVTLASAGSDGDIWVVSYETLFRPS